ncbi:MAG: hypothetical protein ACC630_08355, partial [Nitrospinota bacterium]
DNSLALKIGTGLDYFVRKNLCFSMSLDWIFNKADTTDKISSKKVFTDGGYSNGIYEAAPDDYTGPRPIDDTMRGQTIGTWEKDLSGFNLMFGIRYLF